MLQYKWYYKYAVHAVTWYMIGQIDKKYVGQYCYDKGLFLSQKFKKIPMWDRMMEPFIINQFGVIFIAGHSFIKGMVSDNVDDTAHADLNALHSDIKNQLDHATSTLNKMKKVALKNNIVKDTNNTCNNQENSENGENEIMIPTINNEVQHIKLSDYLTKE